MENKRPLFHIFQKQLTTHSVRMDRAHTGETDTPESAQVCIEVAAAAAAVVVVVVVVVVVIVVVVVSSCVYINLPC